MAPRILSLLLLSLLSLSLSHSTPGTTTTNDYDDISFDFPSLSLRNLSLLGDSFLRNGTVGLSRDLSVPSTGSSSVLFSDPIRFLDLASNTTASFSTRFSFSITNLNPASFGDGLAFFLSPTNQTLGSPGCYLGLINSSQSTKTKFIAIEFDTKQDLNFEDPNDNHIGLDIGTLVSIETANPSANGVDLKSGNLITAWIDYKSISQKVNVFLSYNVSKPDFPLLSVDIDLSSYLLEYMYVGFSASTEGSTELHMIQNWRFQTRGIKPNKPKLYPPHNVSQNSVFKPPISIPNSPNSHHKLGLGLGIAGPAFFCVFLAFFGYISVKKWRDIQTEKSLKAELVTGPKQFSYKELKIATREFHPTRVLGKGGFGTVYKAFFKDPDSVSAVKRAVKRSTKHPQEGKTEFLAELSIIACLRHKNLVPLQGWCVEKGELLLVYEFMPNGSLDNVLYQECSNQLKWSYRYNIAIGLASVLTYLHQECEQQVIHRDIKASNIMLDANFNARLGDFGLARLMDHDKSPVSTLTAGTMGYLAPEYLQCGIATEKTDVFSYGVVLLEVACGRRPIEREGGSDKMVSLVDWVWGLHSKGRVIEGADERLQGEYNEVEMTRILLLGLSCANPDSAARPSMRRVLQILNWETEILGVPRKKPSLSFSCGVPLSIEDIVSEDEDFEIKIG